MMILLSLLQVMFNWGFPRFCCYWFGVLFRILFVGCVLNWVFDVGVVFFFFFLLASLEDSGQDEREEMNLIYPSNQGIRN